MSYILDALKRTNTERERATVPGLHTQPLPTPAPTAAPSLRRWPALALAAGLLLSAVAAGLWFGRAPADDAPAPVAAAAPSLAPAAVVAPVPVPAAPATTPATPTPPAPSAVTAPAVAVRTPAPAPAPPKVVRRPQVAKPGPSPVAVAVAKPAAPPLTKTALAPAVAASTARFSITLPPAPAVPPPLPLLSELPAELRRQIPPLTITGAVYSKNPGQRLLLVNNQVLKQGSLAAPELTLDEIGERSSVFNFRETRFRLTH